MSNTWKVSDKSLPLVACVMLMSPGRERYQDVARRCFLSQTYGNLVLVEMDAVPGVSIGEMRNRINAKAAELGAEIIAHWDDDDWSEPSRIEDQAHYLHWARQFAVKPDCVGLNEMMFWREAEQEAWLYSNGNPEYAVGTSLMYLCSAWQTHPFLDLQHGEDTEWLRSVRCLAAPWGNAMIARIHGGNSSSAYDPVQMWAHNNLSNVERNWQRVPDWDDYCRQRMAI